MKYNLAYILVVVFAGIASAGTFDLLFDDFSSGTLDAKWQLTGVDAGETITVSGNSLLFQNVLDTAGVRNRFGGFNMFLRLTADVFIPAGATNGQQSVIAFSDSNDHIPIDLWVINENGTNKLKVRKRFSSGTVVYDSIGDLAVNSWSNIILEVYMKGPQTNQSCYFSVALNGTYLRSNIFSYPHAYPIIADTHNGYNVGGVMDTLTINSSITGIAFDNIQVSNNYIKFKIAGDLDHSGMVNFKDFTILANNWLNTKDPWQ